MIRILLADDQHLVRGAMSALLSLEDDLDVVAEVGRGDEVVPAAVANRPDVAVLDVEMPGLDGIAATAQLRERLPACRVLVVTTFGRPGYLRRAMAAGASGFMVKDAPADRLADAIRRVHQGLRVVDPALAAESLAAGESPLTAREREVLGVARDGGDRGGHRRRRCTCRRGPSGTTCRRRSARPGPGPGRRPPVSPRPTAGSDPPVWTVVAR